MLVIPCWAPCYLLAVVWMITWWWWICLAVYLLVLAAIAPFLKPYHWCCLAAYALLIENFKPVQKSTWIMSCLICVMMLMLCHCVLLLEFDMMMMKHDHYAAAQIYELPKISHDFDAVCWWLFVNMSLKLPMPCCLLDIVCPWSMLEIPLSCCCFQNLPCPEFPHNLVCLLLVNVA